MSGASLPPLPPSLERGARALRDREPPASFAGRLTRALEQQAQAPSRPSSRWASLAVVVPALTAAVLLLHVALSDDGGEPLSRFEEHHVVLDEDGEAWLELDLWTHHHEGAATVRVDTPTSVHVETADADRACGEARCLHRFVATPPRAPLRVRLSERGRHSITVEHTSSRKRVREEFLVHAR